MFRHLCIFTLLLMAPAWMRDRTPDENHFYRRLFTVKHRAKKARARQLWIAVLLFLLLFPYPPLIVAMLLFTTFLTFSLLDESN